MLAVVLDGGASGSGDGGDATPANNVPAGLFDGDGVVASLDEAAALGVCRGELRFG